MKLYKVTAKHAEKIAKKLGLCFGNDGRTFYATNETESELWEFDSKKDRDFHVANSNA